MFNSYILLLSLSPLVDASCVLMQVLFLYRQHHTREKYQQHSNVLLFSIVETSVGEVWYTVAHAIWDQLGFEPYTTVWDMPCRTIPFFGSRVCDEQ